MGTLALRALPGIGEIAPGADLGLLIADSLRTSGIAPAANTVLVVAQKIVSKAENRYVYLDEVVPTPRALEIAATTGKDAALVEAVLQESSAVVRTAPNTLIVRHRLGRRRACARTRGSPAIPRPPWGSRGR
jgi:coenzyme F420-0:L-glutamate ligase/coenzyme F420-1:gamma-L-glutamate ligase